MLLSRKSVRTRTEGWVPYWACPTCSLEEQETPTIWVALQSAQDHELQCHGKKLVAVFGKKFLKNFDAAV